MSKIRSLFLALVVVLLCLQVAQTNTTDLASVASNPLYQPQTSMSDGDTAGTGIALSSIRGGAASRDYYPWWPTPS